MAALPYIQLYVADYLADTMHLTTEEHGAYLLIIMNYWQTGKPIPIKRLAAVARLSNERWNSVKETLQDFFIVTETHWHHNRIDEDLSKVSDKQSGASKAGKASAAARKAKKEAELKQKGNDRSTNVEKTLERKGNHTDTDTDTDTEDKESAAKASPPAVAEPSKKNKRGTRLPDDWKLTAEYINAAAELRPDLSAVLETVAGNFADYWHAKAGQGATKIDWLATWRNWLRNEKTNPGGSHAGNKSTGGQSYAARRSDLTDAVTDYERATNF